MSLDGLFVVILAAVAAPAVVAISATGWFLPIFVITAGPAITRYAGSGFLIQVRALLTMCYAFEYHKDIIKRFKQRSLVSSSFKQ